MAAALGLAAQATILQAEGRSAIAVLRYDRRLGRQGQLVRLHQEDFAQANGLPPGRKIRARAALPGLDLKTLPRPGVMSARAMRWPCSIRSSSTSSSRTTDAHAKNYSLILPLAEPPRLAPLYDVSSGAAGPLW